MRYFVRLYISVSLLLICCQLTAQTSSIHIKQSGNVGIGTATPEEKLQVEGNVKVNGGIMDQMGLIMPVGAVLPYAGSIPPPGWLLCNGAAYSKTGDYKDLFAVIGFTYGSNGADTFKVPKLDSAFIMGALPGDANDALGKSAGADTHSHTLTMPGKTVTTSDAGNHSHKLPSKWYDRGYRSGDYVSIDTRARNINSYTTQDNGSHSHQVEVAFPQVTTSIDNGRNRPQWLALNYIIKY